MRTPVSYNPLQYACHSKKILNLTVYTLHIQFLFGQCSLVEVQGLCTMYVCVLLLAQVKDVMSDNINKVVERGEKLDDLGERAG
jgi:hypothetical protein